MVLGQQHAACCNKHGILKFKILVHKFNPSLFCQAVCCVLSFILNCVYSAVSEEECGFRCVNTKCVSINQTCDGIDDCGDRSDEMCCSSKSNTHLLIGFVQLQSLLSHSVFSVCAPDCRNGSFRCKTGVCVHDNSLGDKQIDCLDGEDEAPKFNFSTSEFYVKKTLDTAI